MKMYYNVLLFTIFYIFNGMNAATNVFIKNEYRKPIVLNLDGVDRKVLQTKEFEPLNQERLTHWPKQIKIKVLNSSSYHSGIQKELQSVWNAAQNNSNLNATITILDTNNPFFFDYDTDIKYTTPGRPQSSAPASSPSSPSAPKPMELEQKLFTLISNKQLTFKDAEILIQEIYRGKYYGQDFSNKVAVILKAKNYFGSTTQRDIAFEFTQNLLRVLLEIKDSPMWTPTPDYIQKEIKDVINTWYMRVTGIKF